MDLANSYVFCVFPCFKYFVQIRRPKQDIRKYGNTSSIVVMTQRIPFLGFVDYGVDSVASDIEAPTNTSNFFHNGISNFYHNLQGCAYKEFFEETKNSSRKQNQWLIFSYSPWTDSSNLPSYMQTTTLITRLLSGDIWRYKNTSIASYRFKTEYFYTIVLVLL